MKKTLLFSLLVAGMLTLASCGNAPKEEIINATHQQRNPGSDINKFTMSERVCDCHQGDKERSTHLL